MRILSKISKIAILLIFLSLSVISCSDDQPGDIVTPENTMAAYIANRGDFSSLAAAMERTGLTQDLEADSLHTLFAPTNTAFNSFLSGNDYQSLDDVPEELLRQILLYHLQEGVIMSGDFSTGYRNTLAQGMASEEYMSIFMQSDEGFEINGMADVIRSDIQVDNGVIHAVDAIIPVPDVRTFILADSRLDILAQAFAREDEFSFLEDLQSSEEPAPFTLFAPQNDAFAEFLELMEVENLDEISSESLRSVLGYHLFTGENIRTTDLSDGMTIPNFQGEEIAVNIGEDIHLTDSSERTATLIMKDIQANNGVIHILDAVLIPGSELPEEPEPDSD